MAQHDITTITEDDAVVPSTFNFYKQLAMRIFYGPSETRAALDGVPPEHANTDQHTKIVPENELVRQCGPQHIYLYIHIFIMYNSK